MAYQWFFSLRSSVIGALLISSGLLFSRVFLVCGYGVHRKLARRVHATARHPCTHFIDLTQHPLLLLDGVDVKPPLPLPTNVIPTREHKVIVTAPLVDA